MSDNGFFPELRIILGFASEQQVSICDSGQDNRIEVHEFVWLSLGIRQCHSRSFIVTGNMNSSVLVEAGAQLYSDVD